jgi:hypothetical protein
MISKACDAENECINIAPPKLSSLLRHWGMHCSPFYQKSEPKSDAATVILYSAHESMGMVGVGSMTVQVTSG